jgi:hypothetical protein
MTAPVLVYGSQPADCAAVLTAAELVLYTVATQTGYKMVIKSMFYSQVIAV